MNVEQQRIEQIFNQLAVVLGGGVHVQVRDVVLAIDATTKPELTDVEFEHVRECCTKYVPDLRAKAVQHLWS